MKIICIGRNYIDHAKELNNPIPENPIIFMKPSTALLTENKPFYLPEFSNDIHHEVEVIIKISKNGRHVQPKFASSYYEKIGLGIDFTARDVQQELKSKGHPWELAKAFDHSAVVGDFIDKPEFESLNAVEFHMTKNGTVVQTGTLADLIFDVEFLICHISRFFTLQKGDLIYTGTPKGVGRVEKGDQLVGYMGTRKMFQCDIK